MSRELTNVDTKMEEMLSALQMAHGDLENLTANTKIATIFLDTNGLIRRYTPEATVLFRLRLTDLGWPIAGIAHNFNTGIDLACDVANVLRGKSPLEKEIESSNGKWYLRRATAYRNVTGDTEGVVITFSDITELKLVSQAFERSDNRFRSLYENNPTMYLSLDTEHNIVSVNRHGVALLGRPESEIIGRNFCALHTDAAAVAEHLKRSQTQDSTVQTWQAQLSPANGDKLTWLRSRASKVLDPKGDVRILVVCEDITEERRLREQVDYRATHDELTGLLNRQEFEQVLARATLDAQENGTTHALCFLDLDRFKSVNDTYSYAAGNELLKQTAQRLGGVIRDTDVLARLGGDKFALLLTSCSASKAWTIAQGILETLRDYAFMWQTSRVRIGACIGIVPVNETARDAQSVLQVADAACLVAKEFGSNSIHVLREDDVLVAKRNTEMAWANTLRSALAEDRIEIFAQPIVNLQDPDALPGYETLARLRDEDGALWSPEIFINAAARHGLLRELDQTVVRKVLRYLSQHDPSTAPYRWVSINLSGNSLTNHDFSKFLIDAIRKSAVPPEKLCFEITETSMITNLTQVIELIADVKALGCHFALDDFGTGLSSFQYLKLLPVDYLKIDGSFIRDLLTDPIDRAMVKSINDIAHIMGKKTVAEFVETGAVATELKAMKVDAAQGYFYARPHPIVEVMGPKPDV